jgi:hypothetical protein
MDTQDNRYKKLGTEKKKDFNKDFDTHYEKYRKKANELGFEGELKFVKEHGKVLIYVVI